MCKALDATPMPKPPLLKRVCGRFLRPKIERLERDLRYYDRLSDRYTTLGYLVTARGAYLQSWKISARLDRLRRIAA